MYRVVLAAYFTLSLAVAPEPSAVSGPPPVLPVFVDPLGAGPLEPIEGSAAEEQAELAVTEPGVAESDLVLPDTGAAPPTTETPALSPTTESAAGSPVAAETETASPTPAAVAQLSEAATPTTAATGLPETTASAAAGALVASVDLVIEPERLRPSPLPDRPRWTDAVDEALGWRTGACKFAYYAVGPRDCRGDVHRDHLVAWAEAWDSGLSYADAERWYLDDDNLWVMPAGENISKSDDDPAEWKPQDTADWCPYARDWIAVKAEWSLTADRAEADALREMLSTCTGTPPPESAADSLDAAAPLEPDDNSGQPGVDSDLEERLQDLRSLPCGEWGAEERALARQAPDGFDWGRRDGDNDGTPCDV